MANFFFFDEESNTDKEMQASDILLYSSNENTVYVSVAYYNESFWLTQKAMAELFTCSTDNISLHLKNIYEEQELEQSSTTYATCSYDYNPKSEITNIFFAPEYPFPPYKN